MDPWRTHSSNRVRSCTRRTSNAARSSKNRRRLPASTASLRTWSATAGSSRNPAGSILNLVRRDCIVCVRHDLSDAQSDSDAFSTLCTIHADTSKVVKQKHLGSNGIYYTQIFDIVLSCGLTEMKAQISWMENVRFAIRATDLILIDLASSFAGTRKAVRCIVIRASG